MKPISRTVSGNLKEKTETTVLKLPDFALKYILKGGLD